MGSKSHHYWRAICVRTTFLLVPEILWQVTLVATGLVSLPAFPSEHPSETFSLTLLQERSTPTFLV